MAEPRFATIPIRIEAGVLKPSPQGTLARFNSDWFHDEPSAFERHEKLCQAWIKAYEPRAERPGMLGIMREAWDSQTLSNQFYSAWLEHREDPNADLYEFTASLKRSQERRRKRTLRERLPSIPRPRLRLRRRINGFLHPVGWVDHDDTYDDWG